MSVGPVDGPTVGTPVGLIEGFLVGDPLIAVAGDVCAKGIWARVCKAIVGSVWGVGVPYHHECHHG